MSEEQAEPDQPLVVDLQDVDEALPDPEAFKATGRDLVVKDPSDELDLWTVLDRHDESMILDELQRRALDVMIYDFGEGGRRTIGLSYAGVMEAIRLMNYTGKVKLAIDPQSLSVEREDTPEGQHYVARVYARDEITGQGQFGVAKQPAYMKKRNGDEVWDSFAETKAVSKAQRNALKAMIPSRIEQTILAQVAGDPERVKKIAQGNVEEKFAELPPPATGEAADELRESIRELYDRIKEEVEDGRTKLTPAMFDLWFRQADHSEERLADFRDHLQQRLDEWTAPEGATASG